MKAVDVFAWIVALCWAMSMPTMVGWLAWSFVPAWWSVSLATSVVWLGRSLYEHLKGTR